MGRPAKAASLGSRKISKEEKENRLEIEDKLKGSSDKLLPPLYLNAGQREIFEYIMRELEEAKILGNLDLFILSQTAISVERIQNFDQQANDNPACLLDVSFRQARAEASKEFFRCCNELCLSPQSRAKLSIATVAPAKEKKTLMDILNEDNA